LHNSGDRRRPSQSLLFRQELVLETHALGGAHRQHPAAACTSQIIAGFLFGLYLTWRGITASRPKYYFHELYRQFIIGLTAIILLLIVWGISGSQLSSIWSSAGSYVVAYFGLGLLALAVISLESLRSKLLHHQEAAGAFQRRWLSMMVTLVLIIVGISGAISNIFYGGGVQKALHFLSVMGNWLLTALSYILLPAGLLAEGLIFIGRWLLSLLKTGTKPKFEMPDLSDFKKAAEGQPPVHIPDALLLTLKWGGLALIIGIVVFLLARALIRYWDSKSESDVEEVHETFWSWSLFRTDLRRFLGWLFRWAHRRRKVSSDNIAPPTPIAAGENEIDKIFNIRELYQAVLWQGRQAGIPRRKSETPYEYRQNLESHLNIPRNEIELLTEAYVTDRYGLVNPTPQKVELLNRIWRSLRHKMMNPENNI
jgi:hypothetical protein